jgi:hypothetical protein
MQHANLRSPNLGLSLPFTALLIITSRKDVPAVERRHPMRRFLVRLFFTPEDGGDMFLRKIGSLSTEYTASYSRI